MKRTMWAGVALLAAACGGGNAAHSNNTAGTGAQGSHAAITAAGCLRDMGQSGTGTQFILAAGGRSAAEEAVGTSGSIYMLEGDDGELRQHVNQQVEISGRLETAGGATGSGGGTPMGSGASRSAPTANGGGGSPSGSTISGSLSLNGAQRLRVESVRLIAATCPAQ